MEPIARGQWTEQEILAYIRGKKWSKEWRFRGDVYRGGAKIKVVTLLPGSSVTLDSTADILRTARFVLYDELNWLTDEIQPVAMLRMEDAVKVSSVHFATWRQRDALRWSWANRDDRGYTWAQRDAGFIETKTRVEQFAEFPLGMFILSTPTESNPDGVDAYEVEAYDHSLILIEDSIDEPLYIPAGTKYLDAVQARLVGAGITNIMIADYVDTETPADRIVPADTPNLTIANTLLSEINFEPVYFDINGRAVIEAYKEPAPGAVDMTYVDDDNSILALELQMQTDYFGTPNVFKSVCSNPDMDETYTSVYVNDNPLSRTSTVRRGRRIKSEVFEPDQIASQEELDAFTRRKAYERTTEKNGQVLFQTAIAPYHGRKDQIGLRHPKISEVVPEYGWTLPLEPGAWMQHDARRETQI